MRHLRKQEKRSAAPELQHIGSWLIFSANHAPKSKDASAAFFRRWLVIPFDRTFSEGAAGTMPRAVLDAQLSGPAELSGVLNRALETIASLRANGFSNASSTTQAMDEFRQATDPLAVWLDRNTVLRPEAFVTKERLYKEYLRDCMGKGHPTISKTAFGRAVKKLRPTVVDVQKTLGGVVSWCYTGLGLVAQDVQ